MTSAATDSATRLIDPRENGWHDPGVPPASIVYFTHGTTVGVNTVIQRKGVRLALFTTENFVDVLEVARLKMPDPYSLLSRRPDPLARSSTHPPD